MTLPAQITQHLYLSPDSVRPENLVLGSPRLHPFNDVPYHLSLLLSSMSISAGSVPAVTKEINLGLHTVTLTWELRSVKSLYFIPRVQFYLWKYSCGWILVWEHFWTPCEIKQKETRWIQSSESVVTLKMNHVGFIFNIEHQNCQHDFYTTYLIWENVGV